MKKYKQFFESLKRIPIYKKFYLLKKHEDLKREILFILEDEDKDENYNEEQDNPYYFRYIKDREYRYNISINNINGKIKKGDFFYMVYNSTYSIENFNIKIYSEDQLLNAIDDAINNSTLLNKRIIINRFVASHMNSHVLKSNGIIDITRNKKTYEFYIDNKIDDDNIIWLELLKSMSKNCPEQISNIKWPDLFIKNTEEKYRRLINSSKNINKFNL